MNFLRLFENSTRTWCDIGLIFLQFRAHNSVGKCVLNSCELHVNLQGVSVYKRVALKMCWTGFSSSDREHIHSPSSGIFSWRVYRTTFYRDSLSVSAERKFFPQREIFSAANKLKSIAIILEKMQTKEVSIVENCLENCGILRGIPNCTITHTNHKIYVEISTIVDNSWMFLKTTDTKKNLSN